MGDFGLKMKVILELQEITDANGTVVPSATNEIYFNLKGAGELIGENPVKAEAGIASVLFKGNPRKVRISANLEAPGIVK